MNRIPKLAALVIALVVLAGVPAFATTVTYTTAASFQGAITGATTANFDSYAGPFPIVINNGDVVDGITFSSVIGSGNQFAIQSGLATTSGANYLGTTDTTFGGALFGSDSFTMSFSSPITALGLYIIGVGGFDPSGTPTPAFTAGTFNLNIGIGSALSSGTPDINPLSDGISQAYFLGITSDTPFSSATLGPAVLGPDGSGPTWNVDDITTATASNGNQPPPIPEPGTLVLMATGLGALVRRVRKA